MLEHETPMTPNHDDDEIRDAAAGRADGAPAEPTDAAAMSDADVSATLRETDPLAAEATAPAELHAPSPLREPAALREPAPLRTPGAYPTVDASDASTTSAMSDADVSTTLRERDPLAAEADGRIEVAGGATSVESSRSKVVAIPIEVSDVPLVVAGSRDAVAPAAVGEPVAHDRPLTAGAEWFARKPIAATEAASVADEPAVTETAPLAVAEAAPPAGTVAAAVAPVVVRTRTGPVALESQPEPIVEPKPAPVAVRGLDPEPATIVVKPARLASLDIFRGITIALMVLVNNPGSWGHIHGPLEHADWHGWTMTDLVFPFFLFIVGVATPFSLLKRSADVEATRGTLLGHIWLRALSLMLLGWLLGGTGAPWPWIGGTPGAWMVKWFGPTLNSWLGVAIAAPTYVPQPDGFYLTKFMRAFGFVFAYAGILALLVPWRSRRVQTIVPLATFAILLTYCIAMHFVRANAIENKWPADTFGGGIFNPDRMRIPGVLVRIGVCYGVAASIALFAGRKTIVLASVLLLVAYSWLMLGAHFDDLKVGSLEKADNFARRFDVAMLDRSFVDANGKTVATQKHTYGEYPDPEGIISTLPAIVTTLIGVLAGLWLRSARPAVERCAGLLAWGVATACLGMVLSWWLMPVNKALWTPSFAVLTAGLGMLTLGAVFYVADVRMRRWWAWPFKVMGMNAIAAFVASTLLLRLAKLLTVTNSATGKPITPLSVMTDWAGQRVVRASTWADAHAAWLPTIDSPNNQSLAAAICVVAVIFALMLVLYVCRIFVKV